MDKVEEFVYSGEYSQVSENACACDPNYWGEMGVVFPMKQGTYRVYHRRMRDDFNECEQVGRLAVVHESVQLEEAAKGDWKWFKGGPKEDNTFGVDTGVGGIFDAEGIREAWPRGRELVLKERGVASSSGEGDGEYPVKLLSVAGENVAAELWFMYSEEEESEFMTEFGYVLTEDGWEGA